MKMLNNIGKVCTHMIASKVQAKSIHSGMI